ncbi:MAG: 50S ribosomal protein L3 N(5)-glutamine methyltransferase [Legionella sp.]
MSTTYLTATHEFSSVIDFLRFGITQANIQQLYYGHGTDNAWDDMLMLILGSLSLPVDVDPIVLHGQLTAKEKEYLCQQLSCRIEQKIPVPYLINKAYFCGLELYVDHRVLIPRSPIAELISQQFSPWLEEGQVHRILDLCTGSGCIAIACCHAFPEAKVDAVDISLDALDVAQINQRTYDLQDRLTLMASDCFAALIDRRYDIIVSNPPYVGSDEMQTLPAEYLHEPNIALEAASNGLAIVDKILADAADYLTDHGILIVEVGNSAEALMAMYPDVPFLWFEFERGGHGVFMLTKQQLIENFNR